MKLHRTLLAIGLASVFAAVPAFAAEADDDALLVNETLVYDVVEVFGDLMVSGSADVSARSGAVVEQSQVVGGNLSTGDIQLSATLGDSLDGALGNIGVNIAAGVGNAQSNDVAIASVEDSAAGDSVLASSMVFSDQTSMVNAASATFINDFDAAVTDGALAGASGNIGVNVAAGVANAQSNGVAMSVNAPGAVAYATADSNQMAILNVAALSLLPSLSLTATIDGGAMSGASGNIQANVAAGVGNLQHNSLSLAFNR